MNSTPPADWHLPELDLQRLDQKLRALTPEITFATDYKHSYKWSAELAAHGLEPAAIYDQRHTIPDGEYWKTEALALAEVLLQQSPPGRLQTERWRNVCIGIEALLKQQGVDVEEHRQAIDNDDYWSLESDCLKAYRERLEDEMVREYWDNLRAENALRQNNETRTSTRTSTRVNDQTGACSPNMNMPLQSSRRQRQSQRSRPPLNSCKTGNKHGMTLRSRATGVTKRRGRAGGKTNQS